MLSIGGKGRRVVKSGGLSKLGLGSVVAGGRKQVGYMGRSSQGMDSGGSVESRGSTFAGRAGVVKGVDREMSKADDGGFAVRTGSSKVSTRLQGSLFRRINEFLYTTDSERAYDEYLRDGDMFENYHRGYEIQKKSWPMDPLDSIIDYISRNKQLRVIGDFGCGTAKLGQTFGHIKGYRVHSFDLNCSKEISEKYNITICNMKDVPLCDKVLDVAVFCLSLMGTDWPLFIKEACRTLRDHGILIITEVTSRIEDPKSFISSLLAELDLELVQDPINLTNYFTQFVFRKKPTASQPPTPFSVARHRASAHAHTRNVWPLSALKYNYGQKLLWIHRVSQHLKHSRQTALPHLPSTQATKPNIDHKLLKPCMYKKR
ncbi:Rrp8p like methyltransferase [Cryptosporidium canis]|uniref:Ribosomal RNA-processing protein 8 n=1 Tax=Cryptosporidium canis TaxID=195482 RepID=A0ABQ8P5M8_9CRYT|nr:Rrp8p like methyltransferase [Cryptosporidium canis]KAJ1609141.1 Rrp8p like methyltransferase [Cryptosporidium canis]